MSSIGEYMKNVLVGIFLFGATFSFGIAAASRKTNEGALPVGVAPTQVQELAPTVGTVIETVPNNYGGWYELEKFPGMAEVTTVAIFNSEGGEDEPGGGVFTTFEKYGDQGFVESAWMKVDGDHVKFRTKKINGVRYQFEGTFNSSSWSDREREKPLYGTIQKYVKGKKVAETSGNFKYFEPHCWH